MDDLPKNNNIVPAGEFKATCLGLLDEVCETGKEIVITKRGKEVARLVPPENHQPFDLVANARLLGDIVAPTGVPWNVE